MDFPEDAPMTACLGAERLFGVLLILFLDRDSLKYFRFDPIGGQ